MTQKSTASIHQSIISTRQVTNAVAALSRFMDICNTASEGRMGTLIGASRVGKRFVVDLAARKYPANERDGRRITPILRVNVPSEASIGSVLDRLLNAVGAPVVARERNGQMFDRFLRFAKLCEVRVIVLDEFQHLADIRGSDRQSVCNTIKALMNDGHVGVLAVGMLEAQDVFMSDPQLMGRSVANIRLYPFCDSQNPSLSGPDGEENYAAEFSEYRGVLKIFGEKLGNSDVSFLVSRDVAEEILKFTDGCIGRILNLVEVAMQISKENGKAKIDQVSLDAAMKQLSFPKRDASNVPIIRGEIRGNRRGRMSRTERQERSAKGEFKSTIPSEVADADDGEAT